MSRGTLELARKVCRPVTVHFLDPRAVQVEVTPPRAVIRGRIRRLPGHVAPILPQTLRGVEAELARIRDLRFVRWALDNWARDGAEWRPVKAREASP